MPRSSEDDREAVDRAFAEMVAGYHLTADRPEPSPTVEQLPGSEGLSDAPQLGGRPAGDRQPDYPPFRFEAPEPPPESGPPELDSGNERFVPPPPPPLPKPAWPVLIGWLGMGYAVLVVLAVVVGVDLPAWAGWAAIVGFVGGFGLLVTRLPRHRPPDAGDGAVL